jgi:hypothetical protein
MAFLFAFIGDELYQCEIQNSQLPLTNFKERDVDTGEVSKCTILQVAIAIKKEYKIEIHELKISFIIPTLWKRSIILKKTYRHF